jgi:hypothetical protein
VNCERIPQSSYCCCFQSRLSITIIFRLFLYSSHHLCYFRGKCSPELNNFRGGCCYICGAFMCLPLPTLCPPGITLLHVNLSVILTILRSHVSHVCISRYIHYLTNLVKDQLERSNLRFDLKFVFPFFGCCLGALW